MAKQPAWTQAGLDCQSVRLVPRTLKRQERQTPCSTTIDPPANLLTKRKRASLRWGSCNTKPLFIKLLLSSHTHIYYGSTAVFTHSHLLLFSHSHLLLFLHSHLLLSSCTHIYCCHHALTSTAVFKHYSHRLLSSHTHISVSYTHLTLPTNHRV